MLEQEHYLFHVLVWPHGLRFLDEIIEKFESVPNIRIVHTLRERKPKMKRLVRALYSSDTAPKHHLVSKLHYLKSLSGDVMHIFLRVSAPEFEMAGGKGFRHVQSKLISNVKWELRADLNPRDSRGEMTHHHVLHSSDNPFQAHEIAAWLGIPLARNTERLFHYFSGGAWVPWHLSAKDIVEFKAIPVTKLRASIWSQGSLVKFKLDQVPQNQFLRDLDPDAYRQYMRPKIGEKMRDGQSISGMQRLRGTLSAQGPNAIEPIIVESEHDGTYRILDGVHRATTLMTAGIDSIFAAEFVEERHVIN